MLVPILVVTPASGFGEFLRLALAEAGGYQPALCTRASEALALAQRTPFPLAILDAALPGVSLSELAGGLRQTVAGIRLLVLPDEDQPPGGQFLGRAPVLGFVPDSVLPRPFYLPDLLEAVRRLLAPDDGLPGSSAQTAAARAAIPAEESARLPGWLQDVRRAAQHLTRLSLEASAQAALITRQGSLWAYAGQLPQPAAQELAQVVIRDRSDQAPSAGGSDLARFVRLETDGEEYLLYATPLAEEMVLALAFDAETPFSKIRAQAGNLARALATAGDVLDEPEAPLPPLITGSVPDPNPLPVAWRTEASSAGRGREPAPGVELPPANAIAPEQPEAPYDPRQGGYPAPPLHYACVLIPRLPGHLLTGSLQQRLGEWVRQLSLAFAWRLEHLAVQPEYMLWISSTSPDISPGYLVKTIRLHTSQRIFHEFPALAQENPSGDFWAPGYLVVASATPPSPQALRDFVAQTRRLQGGS